MINQICLNLPFLSSFKLVIALFVWPLPIAGLIRQMTNDDIFSYFFTENRIWHFMQILSLGDYLHQMSYLVFWEK